MSNLVLGVDSSTQSCKALMVDADDGTTVELRQAPHPDGTEVDPAAWDAAFAESAEPLLSSVAAIAVGGQQHGMVCLDADHQVVRPALLWNDTRSASQAEQLNTELGGPAEAAKRTGSVLVPSITATKLRWLAENEPDHAARTATVVLPHDYLTWRLQSDPDRFVTDRSDASGTGYFSPGLDDFDRGLLELAFGRQAQLPKIVASGQVAGETEAGAVLGAGMGDNAAAAFGLDLEVGQVLVSLGTSGVASTIATAPVADPTGMVAGFADATGRWLPLSVTLNCARILQFANRLLGVDNEELAALALKAPAGANGVSLLPYFDGERTPNRPNARATMHGMSTATSREDIARAAFEAMLSSVADEIQALDHLTGRATTSVIMIGGATRSSAVKSIAPAVLGVPVTVPQDGEYVARGAARQAAWTLSGAAEPPQWPKPASETFDAPATPEVLSAYRELRDRTVDWS